MARPPRIHVPGGFYHTTLRGNHRESIFTVDSDRLLLNSIVELALAKHGARIHAYCWMTNHLHMLVQIDTDPLANVIRRIASGYARAFQANRETTGHLFENRYHAVLVDTDAYLLELVRYIHLNPVRARLVPRVQLYRWSSHHAYRGVNVDRWVTTDFALAMLSSDRTKALKAYHEFVDCDVDAVPSPFDEVQPDRPQILGSEEFAARITRSETGPRAIRSLESLVQDGCDIHGVRPHEFTSERRSKQVAQARAWIAIHAIELGAATITQIARATNCDPKTIRNAIRRSGQSKKSLSPT